MAHSVAGPAIGESRQDEHDQSTRLAAFGRRFAVPFAAGLVLLLASLANFLNRNDYGHFRLDVALVILALAAVSAAMALLYMAQQRLGRSALEGLLVCLFVDLNSTDVRLGLVAGMAVAGVCYWKKRTLLGPIAVLGSFVLLTSITGFQERWSWIRSMPGPSRGSPSAVAASKPAVLHIIMDEHLGPAGFSALGREGAAFRDWLETAYVGAGFTVYGRAYSEHVQTVNAIPRVLNYGRPLHNEHSRVGVTIEPTEHLRLLSDGYALNIFQSDFADMCSSATYARCTTYDSFSLRPLLDGPLTVTERSKTILLKFLSLSEMAFSVQFIWNQAATGASSTGLSVPTFKIGNAGLTSSVASFAALDALDAQLANARTGDAFVVHLLIPHFPYVVSGDCKPLPRRQWEWRNSSSSMPAKQHAYMQQVRCATSRILRSVAAFRSSPAGSNGTVIIHGDHGSRLTQVDPRVDTIGQFSEADMIASFSTFFAVQTADRQGRTVDQAQPITALVEEFSRGGFKTAPEPDPAAVRGVYLDDSSWRPTTRVPMVPTWVNGPARPGAR